MCLSIFWHKAQRRIRRAGALVHTFAVVNVLLIVLVVNRYAGYLPFIYLIEGALLVGYRVTQYYKIANHHFCLDFCYLGNFLLAIYLIFPGHGNFSSHFFMILFTLSHGPILGGAYAFRNSLVFGDIDKYTSVFIHVMPPWVCYVLRWKTEEVNSFGGNVYDICTSAGQCPGFHNFAWFLPAGLVVYIIHLILYFLWVYVLPHPKLHENPLYLNSYLYLVYGPKNPSPVVKLVKSFGDGRTLLMYNVVSFGYGVFSMAPCYLFYHSIEANTALLGILGLLVIYNGATWYGYSRKPPKIAPVPTERLGRRSSLFYDSSKAGNQVHPEKSKAQRTVE